MKETQAPSADRTKHFTNRGRAALIGSITDTVIIKDGDIAFLCLPNGQVPLPLPHSCGLYYHDCRFLNGYTLKLSGTRPGPLLDNARSGYRAILELTNRALRTVTSQPMRHEDVAITWERIVDAAELALYDRLSFENYKQKPLAFRISFQFAAAFEDIFAVRGMKAHSRGTLHSPRWHQDVLTFAYDGSDGLRRETHIQFYPGPNSFENTTAHFDLKLPARQRHEILIAIRLAESSMRTPSSVPARRRTPDLDRLEATLRRSHEDWHAHQTKIQSSNELLDRVVQASLRDLRVLRSRLHGHDFLAAGAPWYVALFGRDSLIAALQMLAFDPDIAASTLRLLAHYQGTEIDEERVEQPGKILHELRVGELARTHEIPQTPYYGSIDATPLFLILLARHAQWTGRLDLFHELHDSVERALGWIDQYGDAGGLGYLSYRSEGQEKKGLTNQGWKDSGDAIVNADGTLAKSPIALAEVQGYVYLAKQSMADLFRRAGDEERAAQLLREADELRRRFQRDFWLEDQSIFAQALQASGRPAAVVSSNAGQVLWSGIADTEPARRTIDRLMADDMFGGWGIRTLSSQELRFDPLKYHLGTVWPHDNALILAGFRRYGGDEAAMRLFQGILEAALHFRAHRLPELFAGFPREPFGVPVHYPVACHPQAWAAGSIPFMLQQILGLEPDAFEGRLHIVRPLLPPGVQFLEVRDLRIGEGRVDLRFERRRDGAIKMQMLRTEAGVKVLCSEC